MSTRIAALALGIVMGCRTDRGTDDDPGDRVGEQTASTADTATATTRSDVTVVPYVDGPIPLGTSSAWQAPAWMATFDEDVWTVQTPLHDAQPLVIEAGPTGRFAVAYACGGATGIEIRLFGGHVDDGSQVQLRGCPAPLATERVTSRVTVDGSLYGDRPPGNGTCGLVSFAGATWFATCNPVTHIDLNTLVGGPTHLFGDRRDASGRTDRILLKGPLDVPAQGYPVTLDFEGPDAAVPTYVDVVSDLPLVSLSLVMPWSRIWLPQHAEDPGIPVVPPALAPPGSRYLAVGQQTDPKTFFTDTDTLIVEDPTQPLTLGNDFDDIKPEWLLTPNDDGSATAELTAADWSMLTLQAFSQEVGGTGWQVAVSAGFVQPTSTWTIPASDDLPALLAWAQAQGPDDVTSDDLRFPSDGLWLLTTFHSRGAPTTPFEVWRGTFFVDHFADGTRIVSSNQAGALP